MWRLSRLCHKSPGASCLIWFIQSDLSPYHEDSRTALWKSLLSTPAPTGLPYIWAIFEVEIPEPQKPCEIIHGYCCCKTLDWRLALLLQQYKNNILLYKLGKLPFSLNWKFYVKKKKAADDLIRIFIRITRSMWGLNSEMLAATHNYQILEIVTYLWRSGRRLWYTAGWLKQGQITALFIYKSS